MTQKHLKKAELMPVVKALFYGSRLLPRVAFSIFWHKAFDWLQSQGEDDLVASHKRNYFELSPDNQWTSDWGGSMDNCAGGFYVGPVCHARPQLRLASITNGGLVLVAARDFFPTSTSQDLELRKFAFAFVLRPNFCQVWRPCRTSASVPCLQMNLTSDARFKFPRRNRASHYSRIFVLQWVL